MQEKVYEDEWNVMLYNNLLKADKEVHLPYSLFPCKLTLTRSGPSVPLKPKVKERLRYVLRTR